MGMGVTMGVTKPTKKYDAFINYNSRDKHSVDVLEARLKTQGIHCFRDVWHTVPGRGVTSQLLEGIQESSLFIACIGPHSVGPWQAKEMVSALEERLKGHEVIPVFFPGLSPEAREALVEFLQSKTYVLFENHLDEKGPFKQLMRALQGALKKAEPDRAFPESPDEAPRRELQNPYKGLEKFYEEDSARFFGRQKATREILEDIKQAVSTPERVRLFILTGVSGWGKSSLARAGVMAGLKEAWGDTWRYATMDCPGDSPLHALATKMAGDAWQSFEEALQQDKRVLDSKMSQSIPDGSDGKFVLLVDQFEELFTLCQDEKQRRAFMDNLLFAATKSNGKGIVLLTLRSEFLQKFSNAVDAQACNGKAYECGKINIPSANMSISELREAIVGPAHLMGAGYEAALLDKLLEDAGAMHKNKGAKEGILPLLQVVLQELWPHRKPNHIGYEAYKATGGIRGALEKRANAIYGGLNETQQCMAQHIFLNLLRINPDAPETRQRACADGFAIPGYAKEEVAQVLQKLVDGRLLVSDKGEVEIIHEALIHHWSVLRDWVESQREGLKRKQHIEDRAKLWQNGTGDLLTGNTLAAALAWKTEDAASAVPLGLNSTAREFLKASRKHQEDERQKENTRLRRQRIVYAVFAAVMFVLAVTAAFMWKESNRQRVFAEQQRTVAEVRRLASSALLERNNRVDLSLLLAMASIQEMEATGNPALAESERALLTTLEWSPLLDSYLHGHTNDVNALAFSPDGRMLASASRDNTLILWDVKKQQKLKTLRGHTAGVNHLSFSPDGRMLASASWDNTLILWDVEKRQSLKTFSGHHAAVRHLAFSPDGSVLASASKDTTVILWDLEKQQPLETLRGHKGEVRHLAFSPDGSLLASASDDRTVILWNVKQPQELKTLRGHDGEVHHLSFSPDGSVLASASNDTTVILWNVKQRQKLKTLHGHNGAVRHLAFSPNGSVLASASNDTTVILWDVKQQQELKTLHGHHDEVRHLSFSPDGSVLASASNDKTVILWDVKRQQKWATSRGHNAGVNHLSFGPDGRMLASASDDKTVILWDTAYLQKFATFDDWVEHLSFSLNGSLLALTSDDNTVTLWDVEKHQSLKTFSGAVRRLSLSPDERLLALASNDNTVVLWDVEKEQKLETLRGHEGPVEHLSFSPDGSLLASASEDNTLILWDVKQQQKLATLRGHHDEVRHLLFSPDGSVLASASWDSTVILWNLKQPQKFETLHGHDSLVEHLSFSPDGSLLALASRDRTVILFDLKQPQNFKTLHGHEGRVVHLSFSPDGSVLASADHLGTIVLWDVKQQRRLKTLRDHNDLVEHLLFSPDGDLLASASRDNTLILYDLKQQQALGTLRGHDNEVNRLSFSPDGTLLASASIDGTVSLWNVSRKFWREHARKTANRNMTREEWRIYMGEREYRKIFEDLPGPSDALE